MLKPDTSPATDETLRFMASQGVDPSQWAEIKQAVLAAATAGHSVKHLPVELAVAVGTINRARAMSVARLPEGMR